jgi:ATP-binding cassette subfamily B protein
MDEARVGEDSSAPTIYDCQPDPEAKVELRRLPRLARRGWKLLWAAAPVDLTVSLTMQFANGAVILLQLLIGQRGLAALFAAVGNRSSLVAVAPWALAVALVASVAFLTSAVQRERQQILGEVVARYVEGRVLDISTEVELEAFETPTFHNRLQRVRRAWASP